MTIYKLEEWRTNPTVIIASGPSLTQTQVDYVKGKAKVIVINDNYLLAPWADILYACDPHWWSWHEKRPEIQAFKGRKITQDKKTAYRWGIEYIGSIARQGLSQDPRVIHTGQNSGVQAINIAYHLGSRKIILIGYDQKISEDGKKHWFGDHPNKVGSPYPAFKFWYQTIADQCPELGLEIINCTIDTALTCFPCKKLEEVL